MKNQPRGSPWVVDENDVMDRLGVIKVKNRENSLI
jgi:hypothetical protein